MRPIRVDPSGASTRNAIRLFVHSRRVRILLAGSVRAEGAE